MNSRFADFSGASKIPRRNFARHLLADKALTNLSHMNP
jgi:hypothetical protein